MKKKIILGGLAIYLLTALCGCVVVPERPVYYVESPVSAHFGWHHD